MAYAAYWMTLKAEESVTGADRQTSTSHTSHKTASGSQSQPKQATPTSAAPAPVKPAQYETGTKAAGSATVAPSASAGAGAGAGGVAAPLKGAPKPMQETKLVTPSPAVPSAPKGSPKDVPKGSPKDVPKTSAPVSPAKVTPSSTTTSITAGAAKPTDVTKAKTAPAQETLKSTPITSSASQPAKAGAPAAKGGVSADTKAKDAKPAETKVQREVGPPKSQVKAPALDVDPLDALAGTLPSESLKPTAPVYTGPEVTEPGLTTEKGVLVGERDDTLPPGYRKEDLEKKAAAAKPDLKPKQKPLSTDEALDSLSAGFMSSAPPAPKKEETKVKEVAAIDALSAGFSNFAPPPPASTKSPAPPVDKKAKMEKISAPAPPPAAKAPPAPTTDGGGSMSLDALSALEDMLPTAEPVPESPKLKPEDIVTEDKLKKEKGVRVGEREDTLPPDYRFTEEDLKKYPAPEPEPSMDPSAALDVLSGDFMTSSAAPAVQAPITTPSAPPQPAPSDFALDALAGDFVAPTVAPTAVQSSVCTAAERQLSSGTCDALDALSDTLMDTTPAPQPVPVAAKDIVKEKTIEEERLIKMGEGDDTLPPEFRPSKKDLKELPKVQPDVRPKQKSMDDSAALDLLSGDFSSSPAVPAAAPALPVATSPAAPAPAPVLDALADTLIPQAVAEVKPKEPKSKVSQGDAHTTPVQESGQVNTKSGKSKSKSKKPAPEDSSALDLLSDQLTTDVVSTSPTKKGGKS